MICSCNHDGLTPLHATMVTCNMKIMTCLLQAGANLFLKDARQKTPYELLEQQSDNTKKRRMLSYLYSIQRDIESEMGVASIPSHILPAKIKLEPRLVACFECSVLRIRE
jgi:ankyrin repeat protein